jgi:glutaconate CoA-transferase, subunit B
MNERPIDGACTLGEVMVGALARTIVDGTLVFHGFGSPLVQLAMHVAKRTHAPNMVLVAGATYAVNPRPPFLPPTSNDWVLDRGAEAALDIEELFDLAASGRMGRMFLSGVQIDRWGNANVTRLGKGTAMKKLPGGGGGGNLSGDVQAITLWTGAHRARADRTGRRQFRLVDACDFVTNVGHRTADGRTRSEVGYRGGGPDWLVTDLGLFDFDANGELRLRGLYPDTTVDDVLASTGFAPGIADPLATIAMPDGKIVEIVRGLDPLRVHERELRAEDRERRFPLGEASVDLAPAGAGSQEG